MCIQLMRGEGNDSLALRSTPLIGVGKEREMEEASMERKVEPRFEDIRSLNMNMLEYIDEMQNLRKKN